MSKEINNIEITNIEGSPVVSVNDGLKLNLEELNILKKEEMVISSQKTGILISKDKSILNNFKLKRIKNKFDFFVKYYINEIIGINNEFKLTNSWLTLNKKGSFHATHIHTNTILSLTYYIQIKSGDLVFSLDKPSFQKYYNFDYTTIKPTLYNSNQIKIKPKQNAVVIFPGALNHGTTINKSNIDRVMLGANYFVKGIIGSNEQVSYLEI